MQIQKSLGIIALLVAAFSIPAAAQNYVTGINTGSETKVDNAPNNATFTLNLAGSGSWVLAGGVWYMKDGPVTQGTLTFSVLNSGTLVSGCTVTVNNTAFAQQYAYVTLTFPGTCTLTAPNTYSLVLSSNADPAQNSAYFAKGDGSTINVTVGTPGVPDLTVSKSANPSNLVVNSTVTYSIQVTNVGTAATSANISVVDSLPMGLTYSSFGGTGWSCNGSPGTCTYTSSINPGASAPLLTITANVTNGAGTSAQNNVTVSGGGESNTSNDSFSLTSPVSSPDLTVSKTSTPGTLVKGQNVTYTITVANSGNSDSSGTITVVDTLPVGLTFSNYSGTNWVCNNNNNVVTCTTSQVVSAISGPTPGQSTTIAITASVGQNAAATVTNNLTVSGGNDGNTTNNSFSLDSNVTSTPPPVPVPPSVWLSMIGLMVIGAYYGFRQRLA